MYVCMHVCMYMYVCMYVCMHACMHVVTYVYISLLNAIDQRAIHIYAGAPLSPYLHLQAPLSPYTEQFPTAVVDILC